MRKWILCVAIILTGAAATAQSQQRTDKRISILAIGNSFSVDAMQYLYDILKEDGAEEIVLGNLYIGGCTLVRHEANFRLDSTSYKYYKNTDGKWTFTEHFSPLGALEERDWDYITMQQSSGLSGQPDSFEPYLDQLIAIVREKCPHARLVWHMTWAYQQDSRRSYFEPYGYDQIRMFNAIVSTVREKILTRPVFEKVIPAGTAVQYLRKGHYGDNITRDGYHLSHNVGRYLAALTWAATLYGTDPEKITWHPPFTYCEEGLADIRKAAADAVANPFPTL